MSGRGSGAAAPKPPVNILLVDDQPGKLLSYETILAPLGENLIRAGSGKEALEHLLRRPVAVVLADVRMPELDGFELASMIRQHPRFKKTAIILVSGVLVDDSDRLKGYDSGAVDYVSVPIIPEILRAKVAVFADLYRKSEELERLNRDLEQRVEERTAEIAASAARLRLVLSASGIRGWSWDLRGRELSWTTPAGEPERAFPTLEDFLAEVHPEDRAAVRGALDQAAAGDGDYRAEFRLATGGEERWLLGRGTLIRDPTGAPLSIAGIHIDITERKRSEQERTVLLKGAEDARRQAETANRLKDEFLATLSHELRTPLNAIMGWAHLLRDTPLDPAMGPKAAEVIHRNAQLQEQLISDILDVSRITAGKLRLEVRPVDLLGVIEAALESLRPAAAARGVRLEPILDPKAGPISGDPQRLQQVVWNLLSNAVKFVPARQGRVQVRLEAINSHVRVTVEDNGPGIDPDFLPYVFDRFRQGDSSSTRQHHGLGLGLAIVRHLVELHGGTVTASNRDGRSGAVFTIDLPRRSVAAADQTPAVRERHPRAEEAVWLDAAPSLQGIKVLALDDDRDAREVLAAVLTRCGAEVTAVESVRQALAALPDLRPDVVLADIEMPEENGYDFIRQLRALPAESGGLTPAAALTAYAGVQDRMSALLAGFQIHIPKPVQPAELAAVVVSLARRGEAGAD
ncbi:MAG TPA: response regulator [Vicinamibacteria bacterium]